jgi:hypothetical protein
MGYPKGTEKSLRNVSSFFVRNGKVSLILIDRLKFSLSLIEYIHLRNVHKDCINEWHSYTDELLWF